MYFLLFIGMVALGAALGLLHVVVGIRNGIFRREIQASVYSSRMAVGLEAVAIGAVQAILGAILFSFASFLFLKGLWP